ncbi:MAG: hypothetical protein J0L58_14190 [Burkholderiales bacterium]|nr:hypothetical protein [Burkholderiales bacterium]
MTTPPRSRCTWRAPALLLALLAGTSAQAQALEERIDHQRFACLQRERALQALPEKRPQDANKGLMRFKLRFVAPDRPPRIEKLSDSFGDEDMERLARDYLAGYRLPCLHGEEHPVEVVQEFSFSRWGNEPPVPLVGQRPPLRVQYPKQPLSLSSWEQAVPGKALVELIFHENREEPEMRFVFSGLDRTMQRRIQDHVRAYRLLDAGGRSYPVTVTQPFAVLDGETRSTQYRLAKDTFGLVEFLKLMQNLRELPIDLDLDSMNCPFALRVSLRQPYESNGVHQIDTVDANRAYLLEWLRKLKPRYASEAQQKDLHGTDIRVMVPCGRLDLSRIGQIPAPESAPP